MTAELSLGTVQFGLRYGVANSTGQVERAEAAQILSVARSAGIIMLDTAAAYGVSEAVLGELGVQDCHIVTKIPPLAGDQVSSDGIADWVRSQVQTSLSRLRVERLYALLLHRPADLLGPDGVALLDALLEVRSEGVVGKIGVSIYQPEELDQLVSTFAPDIVQAPFNVLDRRMESSGWLARLKDTGAEVHTRSAFLQGLLLMGPTERPRYFQRWHEVFGVWDDWLAGAATAPVRACLGFCVGNPFIDRVIIGVDSAAQLREVIGASTDSAVAIPLELSCSDRELLDPFRWPR